MTKNDQDCLPKTHIISVKKIAEAQLPTQIGEFKIAGYRSLNSSEEFVVLFKGEMRADVPDAGENSFAMFDGRCIRFDKMRLRIAASKSDEID